MNKHKVGTHLIKCLHDVLEKRVDTSEIIVIISDTECKDIDEFMDHIENQWRQMSLSTEPIRYDYDISVYEATEVVDVATELWQRGLIHQPRTYGAPYGGYYDMIGRNTWISTIPEPKYSDPESVITAYETFAILRNLTK